MDHDRGLFGPDSVTWKLHADPTFAVGGLRALLLQALHPLPMAAVVQNGGFEADPWGRLTRTSQYLATITYGTEVEALRASARVRGIHRKLRGNDPLTGEEFRLDRPDLLLWVHCCETDSMLSTAVRGRSGAIGCRRRSLCPRAGPGGRAGGVGRLRGPVDPGGPG